MKQILNEKAHNTEEEGQFIKMRQLIMYGKISVH